MSSVEIFNKYAKRWNAQIPFLTIRYTLFTLKIGTHKLFTTHLKLEHVI